MSKYPHSSLSSSGLRPSKIKVITFKIAFEQKEAHFFGVSALTEGGCMRGKRGLVLKTGCISQSPSRLDPLLKTPHNPASWLPCHDHGFCSPGNTVAQELKMWILETDVPESGPSRAIRP